jgi:hypothetical protein
MSFSPSSKKRKVSGKDGSKMAEAYVDKILPGFLTLKGKEEFMAAAQAKPDLLANLLGSNYTVDVTAPGSTLMPVYANSTMTRNEHSVITKIKFEDGSKLKGPALERLGGTWRMHRKGYSGLIWITSDKQCKQAILLPDCDVEDVRRDHPKQENQEVPMKIAYFAGSVSQLYVKPEDALRVLGVNGVSIAFAKKVLNAMNGVARVDYDFDFGTPTLASALALKNDHEAGKLSTAYATTLVGAFMETSTLTDKITEFLKDPTLDMATVLKIPKPFLKTLVGSDLKPLRKVKLCDAAKDAKILVSDLSITSQFYSDCRPSKVEVYVFEEDLQYGLKAGNNKFQELRGATWMDAEVYQQIVEAITNKRAKATVGATGHAASDIESSDDELNAVDF